MAEIVRKDMKIYGENADTKDIIAYGSDIAGSIVQTTDPDQIQTSAYSQGIRAAVIGDNSTTLQNRQALDYLFSRQLAYLFQKGVPEWSATTEYFVGATVSDANGGLYTSIKDNNTGHAVSDTSYWLAFPTAAQLNEKVAKAGDTMTGALKVPTPASTTNDTTVPTTEWVVKNTLPQYTNRVSIGKNAVFTAPSHGVIVSVMTAMTDWVNCQIRANDSSGNILYHHWTGDYNSHGQGICLPVRKGDNFWISDYAYYEVYFYPAQ